LNAYALSEFVVDVGGGDHGDLALGSGLPGDGVEEPPPALLQESLVVLSSDPALAFSGRVGEGSIHSKPSVAWKNEDPLTSCILPRTAGFSNSWGASDLGEHYITLVSGLGAGHYTERDVREAARTFTGWVRQDSRGRFSEPAVVHDPKQVDDGPKSFLVCAGRWEPSDIVRITLQRPEAATFLARKPYRWFVSEAAPPGPELIERLAEEVRRNEFGIGPIVEVILRSKHFYSRAAYCQRIKSPVEFSAGLVRTLEVPRPALNPLALSAACDAQGQELFAPPNVEGWVGTRPGSTAAPCWSAPTGPRMSSEAYPRTDRRRSTRATGLPATTSPLSAPPGRCWTCCSRATSEMRPAGWRSMPGETAARAISVRRSSAWPTAPNSN
jgi:hypothetical protein